MGRQTLVRYSEGVYHVNGRTNNKEPFPIPMQDCWYIFGYYLRKLQKKFNIKIHVFTLMNNHFHILCSTPDANLDIAMNYFMCMTSKGVGLASGKKNHLYGGRYHWTYTDNPIAYMTIYKYVLRNPIRAGICKSIRKYRWCTNFSNHANFKLDKNEFDEFIPKKDFYEWIDEPVKIDENLIRKCLKKSEFKVPKHRSSRREVDLNLYINAPAKPKSG